MLFLTLLVSMPICWLSILVIFTIYAFKQAILDIPNLQFWFPFSNSWVSIYIVHSFSMVQFYTPAFWACLFVLLLVSQQQLKYCVICVRNITCHTCFSVSKSTLFLGNTKVRIRFTEPYNEVKEWGQRKNSGARASTEGRAVTGNRWGAACLETQTVTGETETHYRPRGIQQLRKSAAIIHTKNRVENTFEKKTFAMTIHKF